MRRAIGLSAMAVVALAAAPDARQYPTFRAGVDLVTVDVSVRRGHEAVVGLTAADFVLTDNGVKQDIDAVTIESLPIDVTLVLDTSESVAGLVFQRLVAAVEETSHLLAPRDRLRAIAFSHIVREISDFTSAGRVPVPAEVTTIGGTSVFDALVVAMIKPRPLDRRQLVIALTDGRDTTSIFSAETAKAIALRSDAVVHIALASDQPTPAPVTPSALQRVAIATGGTVLTFSSADSPGQLFKSVIDDFRSGYVLRYAAKGVNRGGWHELAVTIAKPGHYLVRARKGYPGP